MAKKVAKQEEITNDNQKVKWEDMTNKQRLESYNNYAKFVVASTIKENKAFWNKDVSKEDIDKTMPYNPKNGQCFSALDSILLRCQTMLKGFKEPAFMTMREANLLGGKLKPEEQSQGVKIMYVKKYDYVEKKNAKGEIIMTTAKDKDGNPKLDEKGNPIKKPVMEKIDLNPHRIETITLYHVSQFNDLDNKKLKEKDYESLNKYRDALKNKPFDIRGYSEKIGLTPATAKEVNRFMVAESKGLDFAKEKNLTQTIKQEQNLSQGR